MTLQDPTGFLQQQASRALQGVENTQRAMFNLTTRPPGITDAVFNATLTKPNTGSPPRFTDIVKSGDSTVFSLASDLDELADEYMAKYFPAISSGLKTLPEEWLINVISGVKPFGIDSTIFDLVWQKARDRAASAKRSEQRSLEAGMSARGFSLPPGSLVDLSLKLNQRVSDELADVNREQAIKDAEIKHELLKFAEEQALKYKLGLMQAMADFYRVWATIPNTDIEYAKVRASAMSDFYRALSSYYNVEIAFEELKLKAEQLRTGVIIANEENRVRAFDAAQKDMGLGSAAQAFGTVASGAASAAGSIIAQIESI